MSASPKWPLAASLSCLFALASLALLAYGVDSFQRLDATALSHVRVLQSSRLSPPATFVAHLADLLPLLAMLTAACALGLLAGRPRQAVAALVVVAGANLTTQILKVALAHPRFQAVLEPHQLGPIAFPSGHATAAASIAFAFALVAPPRLRPVAIALGAGFVLAIGAAILTVSWHYPSDVLGGILVAGAWGFAAVAALRIAARVGVPAPAPAQASSRAAISVK